ncbi:type II toxin-antitoxin system Phd/YefM family antitoxin [Glaciihabitans sp. UYNi722]|uniref:type II toxin-antitoxin system Phd/YefM family antitoxin n=1 Tax=Glaciihabitans sp. UYNi722 TaxID=3156344 RepID=UPI0033973EBE
MASTVNIYDAKTQLSQLINRVELGEEIVIARHGRPVARLAPLLPQRTDRTPGLLAGKIVIADDFDVFSPEDDRDWYGE